MSMGNVSVDGKRVFDRLESDVRGYCRTFPVIFHRAEAEFLYDAQEKPYMDFLCGAGSLNYGHNHSTLKAALLEYIEANGIVHGLDLHTEAKRGLLEAIERHLLKPREFEYKVQFTGPTGTNAVEAAFKLARRITGRTNIVSFTNGFHGVTLGSVAATGNAYFRDAAGVSLHDTTFMPYDGYLGDEVDTIGYLRQVIEDSSSGMDTPAAVIVETVQGEGGVNVARSSWLRALERLCREHDILLIVDDIQAGCGRTGSFFSFEEAGITPDLVTLSKSLSGYGLPLSILLIKPEYDRWQPGEHNGTFRGNNLAFVTARRALECFWADGSFAADVQRKGELIAKRLKDIVHYYPGATEARGRGMIRGIAFTNPEHAAGVSAAAFKRGLIVETSGAEGQVVKLLPPLTIGLPSLERGLEILEESIESTLAVSGAVRPRAVAEKQQR